MIDHQLDNPAWPALTGVLSEFATRSEDGLVVRGDPDVTPFWAFEAATPEAWKSAARMAGDDSVVVLATTELPDTPADGRLLFVDHSTQYRAVDVPEPPPLDLIDLGPDDSTEMQALVRLTKPGPFATRTHELGRYLGLRVDGELVAMAGERLRTDLFAEVSAVCVHPDHRRSGLAAALTQAMAHDIMGRGLVAILHVASDNDPAHALYRKIGFEPARPMVFTAFGFRASS